MGKIKKILENELVGGTQTTDVYPVTSIKAVYDENNERLDHILSRRGTVNVSTNYNDDHIAEVLTLSQAIAKVPSSDRVLGFTMTFLSSDGWKTYQFTGDSISNWSDITKWDPVLHSSEVLQELGNSETAPVSQKVVSENIENLNSSIKSVENEVNTAFPNWSVKDYDFVVSDAVGNIVFCIKNGYVVSQNFDSSKLFSSDTTDFAVSDENGNVVLEIIGGHVKTKYFNSSRMVKPIENGIEDFTIEDKNGNSVLTVLNGYVKTKYFNSRNVPKVADSGQADLSLKDENGNSILDIYGGVIKTKYFNSSKSPFSRSGEDFINFAIRDSKNNDILRIQNGHIRTKYFNSKDIEKNNINKFSGKKISFIGDSITTFRDWIPDGYAPWYPNTNSGITSVDKTWWYQLVQELGVDLLKNCSWSGSRVTGDTSSDSNAFSAASNIRIADCAEGDITPDIVVIYIGINDEGGNIEIGSFDETAAIPEDGNIQVFADAYAIMVNKLLKTYPTCRVFCCTLMDRSSTEYPRKNSKGSISQYNEQIRKIALALGADVIDLHSCGINYGSLSLTTVDNLHPNTNGAILMKNRIKAELIAKY